MSVWQIQLCDFLLILARSEKKLEVTRQLLANNKLFEPYSAFKRIDRQNKAYINSKDVQTFLAENQLIYSEQTIASSFIQHYDIDEDNGIIFQEFLRSVLPFDNPSLRSEVSQRPTYDVQDNEQLDPSVEKFLSLLIEREVLSYLELEGHKQHLKSIAEFSIKREFDTIDYNKKNFIDFSSLLDFFSQFQFYPYEEELIAILRRFDKDDDGRLDINELTQGLSPRYFAQAELNKAEQQLSLASQSYHISSMNQQAIQDRSLITQQQISVSKQQHLSPPQNNYEKLPYSSIRKTPKRSASPRKIPETDIITSSPQKVANSAESLKSINLLKNETSNRMKELQKNMDIGQSPLQSPTKEFKLSQSMLEEQQKQSQISDTKYLGQQSPILQQIKRSPRNYHQQYQSSSNKKIVSPYHQYEQSSSQKKIASPFHQQQKSQKIASPYRQNFQSSQQKKIASPYRKIANQSSSFQKETNIESPYRRDINKTSPFKSGLIQMQKVSSPPKLTTQQYKSALSPLKKTQRSSLQDLLQVFKRIIFYDKEIEKSKEELSLRPDFNLGDFFNVFDSKRAGFINLIQFKQILNDLMITVSNEQIRVFFYRFDPSGNQILKFLFLRFILNMTQKGNHSLIKFSLHSRKNMPNYQIKEDIQWQNHNKLLFLMYHFNLFIYKIDKKLLSLETRRLVISVLKNHFEGETKIEELRNELNRVYQVNLAQCFDEMDMDKDSYLNFQEVLLLFQNQQFFQKLKNNFEKYDMFAVDKEIALLIERFDTNKDGKISFNEFITELSQKL